MNPTRHLFAPENDWEYIQEVPNLKVSEIIVDTIQGEGRYAGTPAVFLRLSGCTLNCIWCDTKEVWKQGGRLTLGGCLSYFIIHHIIERLERGHHLVITGGSPLLQQINLIKFINLLDTYMSKPAFIEVEDEFIISPTYEMKKRINHWNHSPKFPSSQKKEQAVEDWLANFNKRVDALVEGTVSYDFKFVATDEDFKILNMIEWPKEVDKSRISLMPLGSTRKELEASREVVFSYCLRHGYRMTDRLHILYWDNAVGV